VKWKWVVGIVSASILPSVVAVYVILSSYNYNGLKPEIIRAVKDDTGRELTLGGDISLKIGFTPALVVKDVSFQNASWGSQPELAKIKRFEIKVRLLPLLSRRIADTARNAYSISNLKIIQGENNLSGSVELNLAENRPKVTAALSAQKLDLRPYFQVGPNTEKAAKNSSEGAGKEDKIFSDRPLPLDTLRQADADVKIQVAQVLLPNFPLNSLDVGIVLNDGVLTVKPLNVALGEGFMDGHLSLQSQGKAASLTFVLKINKLDISYLTKGHKSTEGLEGNLDADIDLRAQGSSIAELMRGLNGKTVLVMGKGRVDNKYIDLLGGDLSSSLFRLLNPFRKETQYTSINCFVSGFNIKDGVASTIAFALNTDHMVVVGEGEINLKTERLNLSLKPVPKHGIGTRFTGRLTVSLSELRRPF